MRNHRIFPEYSSVFQHLHMRLRARILARFSLLTKWNGGCWSCVISHHFLLLLLWCGDVFYSCLKVLFVVAPAHTVTSSALRCDCQHSRLRFSLYENAIRKAFFIFAARVLAPIEKIYKNGKILRCKPVSTNATYTECKRKPGIVSPGSVVCVNTPVNKQVFSGNVFKILVSSNYT